MWKSSLSSDEARAVDALAARAAAADGTDPLNEAARLARADDSARHLLHEVDGELVGYLHHSIEYATAQLVVDPAHRRRGIGTGLLATLAADTPTAVWAFGDTPAARGFAASAGLIPGRALFIMEKPLTKPAAGPVPSGITLRGFTGDDAEQVLAVNAAAFADHPEQGSLSLDDLQARMAESWFDPAGLILAFDGDRLVGFHWTKVHDEDTGEVYVLGVHPEAQGRGIGRALLDAGLDHLRERGRTRVILYVDSADRVAVQLYESTGFQVAHRDVLYVPVQEQP